MTKLYVSAALIVAGTWLITWLISRLADRQSQRDQRALLHRIGQTTQPVEDQNLLLLRQAPRAAGLSSDSRKVSWP